MCAWVTLPSSASYESVQSKLEPSLLTFASNDPFPVVDSAGIS
jgi:hypothetical protein